jgi:hypothetical protein
MLLNFACVKQLVETVKVCARPAPSVNQNHRRLVLPSTVKWGHRNFIWTERYKFRSHVRGKTVGTAQQARVGSFLRFFLAPQKRENNDR